MSEGNFENITKSGINFVSTFVDHHVLPDINFNGNCLINNIYIPKKVINLGPQLRNLNTGFTLGNCLFRFVKLTKNANLQPFS